MLDSASTTPRASLLVQRTSARLRVRYSVCPTPRVELRVPYSMCGDSVDELLLDELFVDELLRG